MCNKIFYSFTLIFFVCILCVSCTKVHAESGEIVPTMEILSNESSIQNSTKYISQAVAVTNSDFQKLDSVLSKMSNRFKAEVSITDKQAFLSDLEKVLAWEKKAQTDDLPLFYLIDKKHSVSQQYVPKDLVPLVKNNLYNISRNDLSLRPDAAKALDALAEGALSDGIRLLVSSSYRSYAYQERLFARYVSEDGLAAAERYSARPGTSQHQLGVALDFGSITDDFAETKMGRWLYAHAAEYGWSLSFPQGYEDVTGFQWECWHFRYIGREACEFQNKWFCGVQQYMIEFIDAWKTEASEKV